MEQQNIEILQLLKAKNTVINALPDLPVSLPLQSEADLEVFELALSEDPDKANQLVYTLV